MSTPIPEILYRNILKESQDGRGSGEIMAYGTAATVVDKSLKKFDLTTLNARGDLTYADDVYSGMILKFTASGREYLIRGINATTDEPTVVETPNDADTGAWTIRRSLWTKDWSNRSPYYPVRNVVNGRLYEHWKDSVVNSIATIDAFLPNGVDDGGAELNSLSTYWEALTLGGTTGAVTVVANSGLLGSYMFDFNLGDRTSIALRQPGKIDLKKGRTYGIIFKSKCDSGTLTTLNVYLYYLSSGGPSYFPAPFTKIDPNDILTSVGNGTDNIWHPQITTTASWDEATFTVPEDIDAGDWGLRFNYASGVDLNIDEIYIWDTIKPDTLAIFGHNMEGGFPSGSYIQGSRCAADLTGWSAGNDADPLKTLDGFFGVLVDGNAPIYSTFTPPLVNFPLYRIILSAASGKIWQAAEIWLAERWTWGKFISGVWRPYDGNIEVNSVITSGGRESISEEYHLRRLLGKIPYVDSDEYAKWVDFINHCGLDRPFIFNNPGDDESVFPTVLIADEILFMRNRSRPVIEINDFIPAISKFDFEEVK